MKTIELEKFIQNLSPDLYSFAYILIPDDLQATQLMIDAVSVVMIQKISILDKWMMTSVDKSQATFEEIKRLLFRSIFEISKKRINQLKLSLTPPEGDTAFFQLEFDAKAALYLKVRGELDLNAIEFIIGLSRPEVLALLSTARIKLGARVPSIYKQSLENVNEN